MRNSRLVIFSLLLTPACVSMPFKKQYHHTERFDIVSMDTSICGKVGTLPGEGGEMEILGAKRDKKAAIVFYLPRMDNVKIKVRLESEIWFSDNEHFAFKFLDYPVIGTVKWEKRSDGEYLVMNIPSDEYSIKEAEETLERYKTYNQGVMAVRQQEEKVEFLKKGFDWVFKKK